MNFNPFRKTEIPTAPNPIEGKPTDSNTTASTESGFDDECSLETVNSELGKPKDQSRRNFLKKAVILGVGAAIMPDEVLASKRETVLPNAEQKNLFMRQAREIGMRQDMHKFATETKNIPRSVRKMGQTFAQIEQEQPGKISQLRALAQENGIDFNILFAIGVVESNWDPNLTGSAGEAGLIQVKLMTARSVGYKGEIGNPDDLTGLYDPATNLEYAIKYFGYVYRHAKNLEPGDIRDMLGHYNQGPSHDVPSVKYNRTPVKISLLEERAEHYADKVQSIYYHYMNEYSDVDWDSEELYVDAVNSDLVGSPIRATVVEDYGNGQLIYSVDKTKLKKPDTKEPNLLEIHELANNTLLQKNLITPLSKIVNETGISFAIITSIIAAESGWKSDYIGNNGGIGLMNITPEQAQEVGIEGDLTDPLTNIATGMKYFRKMLDEYADGDIFEALSYYKRDPHKYSKNAEDLDDDKLVKEYKEKISGILYYYYNRDEL